MSCDIILIVEDNKDLNEINSRFLELNGYKVYSAYTLSQARELLGLTLNSQLSTLNSNRITPSVILLDVMLPDGDGIDFCKEIYGMVDSQIIFLTGKTEEENQIKGLSSGGYAYLTKPYPVKVLLGYVEAAIRQKRSAELRVKSAELNEKTLNSPLSTLNFKIGGLELDIAAGLARFDGADLLLTQKEFALLLLLAQNAGQTVSIKTLYETVWGAPLYDDKQSLWRRVNSLKSKLMRAAGYAVELLTIRGEGYCLNVFKGNL
jgi:DNA-binding response OmpR family regulator